MTLIRTLSITSIVIAIFFALFVLVIAALVLPPEVPLLYSLSRAQDQLAPKSAVLIVSALALGIAAVQFPLLKASKDNDVSQTLLAVGSLFSLGLLVVSFVRIWLIVT